MTCFPCPYLQAEVELTDERREHIIRTHPGLLPDLTEELAQTLADPDEVRRDQRFKETRLFSREFENVRGGKSLVVVIVSDPPPLGRNWIVTAYVARRLAKGVTEWKRP